jgi:AraC-like DNA-binding protein
MKRKSEKRRSDLGDQLSFTFTFSGVEELEEAAQALGWGIEYRQISKGPFFAGFAFLEGEGICLVSERFDKHLHIPAHPPEGFIGFFLPRLDRGRAIAYGRDLTDGDLIVLPSRSDVSIVSRDEIRNETVFLPEAEFRASARSLAPSGELFTPGSAAILSGDPKRFAAIRHEIVSVRRTGVLDSETASNLMARIILWIADAQSRSRGQWLANGDATVIARRAQTFIEENFHDAIRLEDLCTFAGVGLRTLQRCFTSHLQISPSNYIKVRRLNAARRDLVKANPSRQSVTKIATDNGFTHLGRFSVDYRMYFGESPHETLVGKKA